MFKPFFLYVGYRYAHSKRRNHFISFISLTSMIGIAIGVTTLITVLSVMNGFNKEIRSKMLSVTPHIVLQGIDGPLRNWQPLISQILMEPGVVGAVPYIISQGLLVENGVTQPTIVRGIDPNMMDEVFPLKSNTTMGNLDNLQPGSFRVAIGEHLAQGLGVTLGDKVTLLMPQTNASIAGISAKYKRLVVAAIYRTGTNYDDRAAFVNIKDAALMFKMQDSITGIQVRVVDELDAPRIAAALSQRFEGRYWISDWSNDYASFFEALNMEKTVMWCILLLIIIVAAFNLVSSLVMMVTDKRSDIAILRTMGATPKDVMGIFIAQGVIIGLVGTLIGLIGGLLLAYNVTAIVEHIQTLLNVKFVSEDAYLIGFVPSQIKQMDVAVVCGISLLMSLLATVYPAWRAANIAPAEALRYE